MHYSMFILKMYLRISFWVASSVTKSPLQGTSFDAIPRQSHH